jgi:hypothetical protein
MEGKRPVMPPKRAKKPTKKQIDIIRAWIAAGAKDDSKKDDPKKDDPNKDARKD